MWGGLKVGSKMALEVEVFEGERSWYLVKSEVKVLGSNMKVFKVDGGDGVKGGFWGISESYLTKERDEDVGVNVNMLKVEEEELQVWLPWWRGRWRAADGCSCQSLRTASPFPPCPTSENPQTHHTGYSGPRPPSPWRRRHITNWWTHIDYWWLKRCVKGKNKLSTSVWAAGPAAAVL